jgi:hypothetical protein
MQNKYIALFLFVFLAFGITVAQAGQPQVVIKTTHEQTASAATMDEAALASYITGRLKQALKDEDYTVDQSCDASGCAVVVQ